MVEVDGGTHGTDIERTDDKMRTVELSRLGYRVFRICNMDIYENIDRVLDTLLAFIREKPPAGCR